MLGSTCLAKLQHLSNLPVLAACQFWQLAILAACHFWQLAIFGSLPGWQLASLAAYPYDSSQSMLNV